MLRRQGDDIIGMVNKGYGHNFSRRTWGKTTGCQDSVDFFLIKLYKLYEPYKLYYIKLKLAGQKKRVLALVLF